MRVFRRSDSRFYWYEFEFRGRRYRASSGVANRQVAETIAAKKRLEVAQLDAGIDVPGSAPTLARFEKRFIAQIEADCGRESGTIGYYKSKYKRLKEFFETTIDRIDESLIAQYVAQRREARVRDRKLSPAAVNRELATLRRVLRLAHEWRLLKRVPRIKLLKGERPKEFVVSPDIQRKFLAACNDRIGAPCVLMVECGLRPSEALTLRWADVHLDRDPPSITISVQPGRTKGRHARVVFLTDAAVKILESLPREGRHVFEPVMAIEKFDNAHARIRDRLKLPAEFTPHSWRHTCATRMGLAGVDTGTMRLFFGWSSGRMADRYVHPSPVAMLDAIRRLPSISPTDDRDEDGDDNGKLQ